MALDKTYFDAIHIDVVKKKYYNANKVEAVFADIRERAEALEAENEAMRERLAAVEDKKFEIGDAVLSAQTIYRDILEKANARADEIVAAAEQRAARIENEARRQQDYAVQQVEVCFTRMREQHQAAIEAINGAWQDFLCGLYPAGAQNLRGETAENPEIPSDLKEKVGAIASELFSIREDEE